jgi:hypothetical protein
MHHWLCERDATAGAKHCAALLDLISEMLGGEGGELQALAAKAVCVLALAALDGILAAACGVRCFSTATCHSAVGAVTCAAFAAKGSINAVVEAGKSGSSSLIMQLACSAFFSSMSNASKVRAPPYKLQTQKTNNCIPAKNISTRQHASRFMRSLLPNQAWHPLLQSQPHAAVAPPKRRALTSSTALASCIALLQSHATECLDEAVVLHVGHIRIPYIYVHFNTYDMHMRAFVEFSAIEADFKLPQVSRALCNVTCR